MTTTAAVIGDRFGRQYVGTIYGWLLLGHQITAAFGEYIGSISFIVFSSYEPVFPSAILSSVIAALGTLMLRRNNA